MFDQWDQEYTEALANGDLRTAQAIAVRANAKAAILESHWQRRFDAALDMETQKKEKQ